MDRFPTNFIPNEFLSIYHLRCFLLSIADKNTPRVVKSFFLRSCILVTLSSLQLLLSLPNCPFLSPLYLCMISVCVCVCLNQREDTSVPSCRHFCPFFICCFFDTKRERCLLFVVFKPPILSTTQAFIRRPNYTPVPRISTKLSQAANSWTSTSSSSSSEAASRRY